ncbi:MAG: hypothetical protein JWM36_4883 [Hyphomicrobiales bacterium]|jgi:hypothetical protein|nr:hypothetical protein [Hyphomicrobiales bacterium]
MTTTDGGSAGTAGRAYKTAPAPDHPWRPVRHSEMGLRDTCAERCGREKTEHTGGAK